MRQYGKQRTRTRVSGHQDCATCHPETPTRTGRVRARREAQPLAEYRDQPAPLTPDDEIDVEPLSPESEQALAEGIRSVQTEGDVYLGSFVQYADDD